MLIIKVANLFDSYRKKAYWLKVGNLLQGERLHIIRKFEYNK